MILEDLGTSTSEDFEVRAQAEPPRREGLTEDCVLKLRKVCDLFVREPRAAHMDEWILRRGQTTYHPVVFPECGVVGCVAGWVLMQAGVSSTVDAGSKAARILGLTGEQSLRLFLTINWPRRFQVEIEAYGEQTPAYARAIVRRVEHFIKTGGAE